MENYTKFEGIDYSNTFAKRINSVHQLVSKNLEGLLQSGFNVIDIGGGPAVGAKIIEAIGKPMNVLNVEPSSNVNEAPRFEFVSYNALQMSFLQALKTVFPWPADLVLMVSSAHEIALSYGLSNEQNKAMFFNDLKKFLALHVSKVGLFCIGFPNYKTGVTPAEVFEQRVYTNDMLGHSHPPEELFRLNEFELAFGCKAYIFEQKPMILVNESVEETKLMANFAAFKLNDIAF